ncbi:MAG: acyl-CoA dehydrogenase family protein [Acidimicrobiia bacterium]
MSDDAPSLEEFLAQAEAFLAARWPRKEATRGPAPFVWGEGSDEMKVFQEPEPAEEADRMAAVRSWRRALFDAGYAWITGPAEHGGRNLPSRYERAFGALTRRFDVPGDAMLTVSLGMIAPTIWRFGSPDQHARWLPALRSGELIACQLFSEPNAGSDLASLSTKAEPDGRGGWRISGQKVWTSGAHLADVGEIICRTSDGPRHQNLTAFIVDMRAPGVEVRPLRQMTGGAAFNEVFLTDVAVGDDARLGDVGEGWKVAVATLGFERSAMGHSDFGGVGLLRTDRLAAMLRHTGAVDDPVARQDFARVVVALRAARCLQSRTGAMAKAGDLPTPALSMNKIALSDNFRRLSDFAVRTLGPAVTADTGEWGTYAWTSVLLGTPGYRLGGGTDQILKNILAERVLGLPR